jgi:hypothetical protein
LHPVKLLSRDHVFPYRPPKPIAPTCD